ncbi:hypothetical protein WICPIJ_008106 [Wickerhamomyces pijperi]|uniref:Mediator of RNA polymerase II transcription subunit 11 n=1 Tax=Wickerhamomyces pijperi TaxID=599730 RepID=A0A9P8TII1_WICPI|nr:hypothetical protein WICPIJ_008106 [Wickerhamomyces pijperi]
MSKDEQHPFIQERLDSLHEIDNKLVSILAHTSSALSNITQLNKNITDDNQKRQLQREFSKDIENFYNDLRYATVNLNKEICILDSRISKTGDGGITILPVNIAKKATFAGEEKLKTQIDRLDKLLENQDVYMNSD